MSDEIKELGRDGVNRVRLSIQFGDVVEDGNKLPSNPTHKGLFVCFRGGNIQLTDGDGYHWEIAFNDTSRIRVTPAEKYTLDEVATKFSPSDVFTHGQLVEWARHGRASDIFGLRALRDDINKLLEEAL